MKYLDYSPADVPKFLKTLKAYLIHLGILSEKMFRMFETFDQPPAKLSRVNSDGKTENLDPSILTVSIRKGLANLSKMARIAAKEGFYLADPKKIEMVEEWTSNVVTINSNKSMLSTSTPTSSLPTSAIMKFPNFELKKFTAFEGDVNKYLESVAHDFTEKKVSSFLEDEVYCKNHADTSKGYCVTIFKSFKGSQFD